MADYPNGGTPNNVHTQTTAPPGLPNTGSNSSDLGLVGVDLFALGAVLVLAAWIWKCTGRKPRV